MKIITDELDKMISLQKEKPVKTYVAKYNGKNLKTKSGKSCWKAINHAKAAILLHFENLKNQYVYGVKSDGRLDLDRFDPQTRQQREKTFKQKLWEIVEIVELT